MIPTLEIVLLSIQWEYITIREKGVYVLLYSNINYHFLKSLSWLSQQPLQCLRGQPQHFHKVVLAIAHPEPKHHISHIVPAQHHSTQPYQAHPQQNEDSQRGSQHEVSQQEAATHGGTRGMSGGEGVAVHRKGGEHVHTIMCWPTPTHHRLNNANQDQVQQQACRGRRWICYNAWNNNNNTATLKQTNKCEWSMLYEVFTVIK